MRKLVAGDRSSAGYCKQAYTIPGLWKKRHHHRRQYLPSLAAILLMAWAVQKTEQQRRPLEGKQQERPAACYWKEGVQVGVVGIRSKQDSGGDVAVVVLCP